jgi:hypothetical protein
MNLPPGKNNNKRNNYQSGGLKNILAQLIDRNIEQYVYLRSKVVNGDQSWIHQRNSE